MKIFPLKPTTLLIAAIGVGSPDLIAHSCGPGSITISVGETCPWRIAADRTETVTLYQPSISGDAAAVRVHPSATTSFSSHHGDFTFTGLRPGTAVLTVGWSYAPTGASGTCSVEITIQDAPDGQSTSVGEGRLSGSSRHGIPAGMVGRIVGYFVPESSQKLLVFAQCYGGNAALDPAVRDLPNASVISATSPGVEARYGGYHDDAASELKPEDGRTAADVHMAGSTGRHAMGLNDQGEEFDKETIRFSSEWPLITGTLDPSEFSLAPTSATGDIQSRHIVFYAGQPSRRTPRLATIDGHTVPSHFTGESTAITDTADAAELINNFEGQANTSVTTVGAPPTESDRRLSSDSDYTYSGTLDGLQAAIEEAARAIRDSADPSKEQFILFVGDHGELGTGTFPATPTTLAGRPSAQPQALVKSDAPSVTLDGFETFAADAPIVDRMRSDPANEPGLVVFLEFPSGPVNLTGIPGEARRVFDQGNGIEVHVDTDSAPKDPLVLSGFDPLPFDLDGDGQLGSIDGEGVELLFPISEVEFLKRFLGTTASITVVNHSPLDLLIRRIIQVSGSMERISEFDPTVPPRLANPRILADGRISVVLHGGRGLTYRLDASPDLNDWSPWTTVTVGDHPPTIVEDLPEAGPPWFLRAAVEP